MKFRSMQRALALLAVSAAVPLVSGCSSGDSTSGSEESPTEGQFISDESTVGRMELQLGSSELPVASTTSFQAFVYDSQNRPVPGVRVLCDSEQGVAIIEPTSGSEMTGSLGSMSGTVGCSAPGSFQFGCRLPTLAGRRKFVGVKCTGSTPEGFEGFDGAAGGGLGGGVLPPEQGGPGGDAENSARILSISAFSTGAGTNATTSMDIQQGTCNGSTAEPEPFADDLIGVTVANNTANTIRFTSVRYTVEQGAQDGSTVNSPDLAVNAEVPTGTTSGIEIRFLFLDATAGRKVFANGTTLAGSGFKNVNITLRGRTNDGDEVILRGSTSLSFDNFNACSGQ